MRSTKDDDVVDREARGERGELQARRDDGRMRSHVFHDGVPHHQCGPGDDIDTQISVNRSRNS